MYAHIEITETWNGFNYVATQYHQRIYAFTQKDNVPDGKTKCSWILAIQEHDMHYWTYEREDDKDISAIATFF